MLRRSPERSREEALAAVKANIVSLAPNGKNLAKTGLVLSVSKTF